MKTTTNHGLNKPDGTDTVNIEDLNYNADKLDALLVPATTTVNGLMSKTDKAKLNGIAAGANNYTHPATHPASMISGLQKVATSGSYNDLLNKPSTFTPASHDHDDRYYTETEINSKLNGKANTSHTHTKSQISDFPTSLPANGGNADTVDGKHASDFLQTTGGTVNGDVTVTQSLSARKLQLTDYGTPLECGKYLDFHDVGSSNSDYDGRLYVHGAHLAYANGNGVTMVITDEINNLNSKVLAMEKKLGGDYMGKDMVILTKQALSLNVPFTYTNSKGGILRVETPNTGVTTTITVDGSVMSSGRAFSDICNLISSADGYYGYELIIPFNSSVSLTPTSSGITIYPVAYVNK